MSEIDLCINLCLCCFQCGECIRDYESIDEVKEVKEEQKEKELIDYRLIEDDNRDNKENNK